ncbi:MAG: helix-turn-helix transcriptional regulator [Polyangiales bacterium]|nr:helix-turn-helix transcriptional regulator [Sandaracinaceae bacterium]
MSGRINMAVVKLVLDGIRRVAPEALDAAGELATLCDADGAGVPLEPYRAVLQAVSDHAGDLTLLRAGHAPDTLVDPILFVLLNSETPAQVIEKEARLARFIHSRHVVRVVAVHPNGVELEHVSTVDDPPRRTEDLAAAGQHVALFEQIGCQGLRLQLPGTEAPARWVYRAGGYEAPAAGSCARWVFTWDALVPTRRPMPGLDAHLLAGETRPELLESTATVGAVERIARADLGRTWTLSDVAARLGQSPRTLQRALAAEEARFSDVLDRVRVDAAARLLETSALSVTEIGYVCGFADTSHFSRRFKQRRGRSPSAYRSEADGRGHA